jgi:6-phosphogluconolactonase
MTRTVLVHPDADSLAEATATRLLTTLLDVQTVRGAAHLVLTGGGIGTATLAAVAGNPLHRSVDWDAVHLWWGDERFLPEDDPERNHTQARVALLDHLPVPPASVHAMPARTRPGDDPDDAARRYAIELAGFCDRDPHPPCVPEFDVVLLGVGPDGHVASLFPGAPEADDPDRTVIGVRDSPKPPPTRLSLTMTALRRSRQTWLLAAGPGKSRAVVDALERGPDSGLPAADVRGRERTLWLLDAAAAALVPARLLRPRT